MEGRSERRASLFPILRRAPLMVQIPALLQLGISLGALGVSFIQVSKRLFNFKDDRYQKEKTLQLARLSTARRKKEKKSSTIIRGPAFSPLVTPAVLLLLSLASASAFAMYASATLEGVPDEPEIQHQHLHEPRYTAH
ncbi:hypothetical protein O3P69_004299 [Scylla paramamosain]|uniref:Uncharacterized protein n=1 Tax=Scylla paramamosain TaxID=85552 RepID=A0AAW0UG50_SCYPA